VFNGTHKVVALIFATLVALHILAALRHLVMRNGIFSRIWP
jgi:cytochrome b561